MFIIRAEEKHRSIFPRCGNSCAEQKRKYERNEEDNPPADATVAFLRVLKQNFQGYYYNAEPVIIQPVETETEGAESENE
jgi:hypothetical protein